MVAMAPDIAAGATTPTNEEKSDFELVLFKGKEAYVYQVPPAGTAGHRAEMWNVDKWLTEVSVKIVRFSNDTASIILTDQPSTGTENPSSSSSGELFAECPVTLPLITCVEPVIDSSRYFVIRLVDRESGRHVFVGLGFRERAEASDFNAALAEHEAYLKRKEAAESMKKAFDDAYKEQEEDVGDAATNTTSSAAEEEGGEEDAGKARRPGHPVVDYSLKPGEKIHLNLGSSSSSGNTNGRSSEGFLSKKLTKTFSLMFDPENGGAAMAALAPPPPPSRTRLAKPTMGISPSYRAAAEIEKKAAEREEDWGAFEAAAEQEVQDS